jgi:hypothetical protein
MYRIIILTVDYIGEFNMKRGTRINLWSKLNTSQNEMAREWIIMKCSGRFCCEFRKD